MLLLSAKTTIKHHENGMIEEHKSTPARLPSPGAWQTPVRGDCMSDRTCTIDSCKKPVTARGYCRRHYRQDLKARNPKCISDGCTDTSYAYGWCMKHYYRWKRHGNPKVRNRFFDPDKAFDSRTEWQGDCLIWTGAKGPKGYGQIQVDGELVPAHRYAWERENGPIPEDMLVDHRYHCSTACCNTAHLRLATHSQNNSNRAGATPGSFSGARNVYWNKQQNKWHVRVSKNGKQHHFGTYQDIEDAKKAAEKGRQELFGSYAGRG